MPGPIGARPLSGALLVVGVEVVLVFCTSSDLMVQPEQTGTLSATMIVSVAAPARSTMGCPRMSAWADVPGVDG